MTGRNPGTPTSNISLTTTSQLITTSTSTPPNDPCRDAACSWVNILSVYTDTDKICLCNLLLAVGSVEVSACVACEQSVNVTFAQEIGTEYQECVTLATSSTANFNNGHSSVGLPTSPSGIVLMVPYPLCRSVRCCLSRKSPSDRCSLPRAD